MMDLAGWQIYLMIGAAFVAWLVCSWTPEKGARHSLAAAMLAAVFIACVWPVFIVAAYWKRRK